MGGKAIIQKAISFLPFSNKINYIFQRFVTGGFFWQISSLFKSLPTRTMIRHYHNYSVFNILIVWGSTITRATRSGGFIILTEEAKHINGCSLAGLAIHEDWF